MNISVSAVIKGYTVTLSDSLEPSANEVSCIVDMMLILQATTLELTGYADGTPDSAKPPVSPQETVTIHATKLTKEFDSKGNKRYRVRGGKYAKWGVPIYPEVLRSFFESAKLDIPADALEVDIDAIAVVELEKGTPKRVRTIIPKE